MVKGIEWPPPHDVRHGIAAADSTEVMDYLKNPVSSNSKVISPCVNVTIHSGDALLIDSDASKEYMRLFWHKTSTADEPGISAHPPDCSDKKAYGPRRVSLLIVPPPPGAGELSAGFFSASAPYS